MLANKHSIFSWLYLACLLHLSGLIAVTPLYAQNLVIGVEDVIYYPYFDFTDSKSSFSKNVLDRFAADSGHTITYVALPIKKFSKWVHHNNVDFKFPDNKRWHDASASESRATHFSQSVLYMRAGTIVLAKNQNQPPAFFKNLGMVTGFKPTLWLEKIARNEINILEDTSPKVLVKHLVNNLVDGIDIDIAVANHYLKQLNFDEQLAYNSQLRQQVFAYQLSTVKFPEIIAQFDQWLRLNSQFIDAQKRHFNIPNVQPAEGQVN